MKTNFVKNYFFYRIKKLASFIVPVLALSLSISMTASAEEFDPAYYVATYPDVATVIGTDANALYKHYMDYGMKEGRTPYKGARPGEAVEGIADTKASMVTAAQTANGLVALNKLNNYKSLKKNMSDAEFQAAYDVAYAVVAPIKDKSRSEQLMTIAGVIRYLVDSGLVVYSTSEPHYNDPYGYFVKGVSSCAGCTRATGLCLNILGIPYEHVNENQWSHQWCRVQMEDGSYWICDAYGLYCGPEPAPYKHPNIPSSE